MKRTLNADRIKHLYSRMAFGLQYAEFEKLADHPVKKEAEKLIRQSRKSEPLRVVSELLIRPLAQNGASEAQIKEYIEKRNRQELDLNIAWMERLAQSSEPLREKMTLFWHGHFACRLNNGFYLQQLNNVQREHALGNFRTLLTEVSKSPAMLSFLNNQQNRKGRPNENFARELMELFTLGIGNYTENDIRESARAFTGWQYRGKTGEFFFNEKQHDTGVKRFFGREGHFSGEDIIDMILANRQTSKFIATKVYRFFVNDTPDNAHISEMAEAFYNSRYEIRPMLETMLSSEWFYDSRNVGNKIKSPVELLTGLNRMFSIRYENPRVLLQLQRALGQALFYPPNVAGWPGGTSWIDSSSLMARLKLPSLLLNGGVIEFSGKADPEDEAFIAAAKRQRLSIEKRTQTTADWQGFTKKMPRGIQAEQLAYFILAPEVRQGALSKLNAVDLKGIVLQVISSPEYQLC